MKLLYMNQGGGGNWGAINYSDYHLLLLAESSVVKTGFTEAYTSKTTPKMSIQERESRTRLVSDVKDLDKTLLSTRPLVAFQLTKAPSIQFVFVHLKSANANKASEELENAETALKNLANFFKSKPTLWIGDFNRAVLDSLGNAEEIFAGGGQSAWNLDRVVRTGTWDRQVVAHEVSKSADNAHVAIAIDVSD